MKKTLDVYFKNKSKGSEWHFYLFKNRIYADFVSLLCCCLFMEAVWPTVRLQVSGSWNKKCILAFLFPAAAQTAAVASHMCEYFANPNTDRLLYAPLKMKKNVCMRTCIYTHIHTQINTLSATSGETLVYLFLQPCQCCYVSARIVILCHSHMHARTNTLQLCEIHCKGNPWWGKHWQKDWTKMNLEQCQCL